MDDVQKSKIRLTHWIDHNRDHLKGYLEVLEVLEREGLNEPAEIVRRSIDLMEQANAKLDQALALLQGPELQSDEPDQTRLREHSHPHSHHGASDHEHEHAHDDSHGHDHKKHK